MRGAAVWVAAHFRLLVALLDVQHIGIAISELIGDAPRPIHMDGIARWVMATQGVIVETGCRVALNWDLPHFVWRNYPETGKLMRDSCELEEALVARSRCFGPKR